MHLAFISTKAPCTGCGQPTSWRVGAGKSTYAVCTSCMGHSERMCATGQSHKLCN